jgi:hypothetical protein
VGTLWCCHLANIDRRINFSSPTARASINVLLPFRAHPTTQCRRRERRPRRPRTAARRPRRGSPGAAPSASTLRPPPAGASSPHRREPISSSRSPAASAPPDASRPSKTRRPAVLRGRWLRRGCRPSPSARRPPRLGLRRRRPWRDRRRRCG